MSPEAAAAPAIRLLPDTLISQIAAGEVLERPSNAVKELVENALDAGATNITVHVEDGGIGRLAVRDDGHGIVPDQLALALQRHATSKLGSFTDLESLGTYGFRGEALASLASVSRLRLASRAQGQSRGAEIRVCFGEVEGPPAPVALSPGTLVEAEGFFERLPARRKFLRAPATELAHCVRTLRELALWCPATRFALYNGERRVLQCTATDPYERFLETFAPDFEAFSLEQHSGAGTLRAWLVPPTEANSRGDVWCSVNGRPVRNRLLGAAVRQGYQRALGPDAEPCGALGLVLAPASIDANAHPQKLEVRLLDQDALFRWIASSVERALLERKPAVAVPATFSVDTLGAPSVPPAVPEGRFRYLGGHGDLVFVLAAESGDVFVLERHALGERLRYEDLRASLARGTVATARLEKPLVVPILAGQETFLAAARTLGFAADPFGSRDVAITERPAMLEESHLEEVFRLLLARLAVGDTVQTAFWAALAAAPCGSARGPFGEAEARAFVAALPEWEDGWACPHGKPVSFRVAGKTLEKHFAV